MNRECPRPMRSLAESEGVAATRVQGLWERHVNYQRERGEQEFGGRPWLSLCRSAANDDGPEVVRDDDVMARAQRRAEREAKDLADAEYAKTAISLPEWLADLRIKPDFSEDLTPIEAHLVAYREPQPGEDSAAWLMAALKDYRGPIAECHKRRRRV